MRTLLVRVWLAAVVLALPLASPAAAQGPEPGTRFAALEGAFAADLAGTLEAARAWRLQLQRGAALNGLGSLGPALDRLAAADVLIAGHQERVGDRLKVGAAPAAITGRHAAMQTRTRQRMDVLARLSAAIRDAAAAGDRSGVIAGLTGLIAALEADPLATIDRTPLGAALPYRPLALPQVAPALGAVIIPAYAQATQVAPTSADLAATADVPFSAPILAQAQALGRNPIAIFEFVQNQVATEFYHGAMKGAAQTLAERSGNAVDQASLLIALLRTSGVPARYVRGVVRAGEPQMRGWSGAASMRAAADLLTRGGIPFTAVTQGGAIAALDIEHTWVEAFVPYGNYRGAPLDTAGHAWVPLDPSFTMLDVTLPQAFPAGFVLASDALVDEYLAAPREESPLQFVLNKLSHAIDPAAPGAPVAPYLFKTAPRPVSAGLLGSTLPYPTISVNGEYAELPASLRHVVRFRAQGDDGVAFDVTVPVAEVLGRRVTLSYIPATVEDQIAADAFLGLDSTPAYLLRVRPVLKIGGAIRAAGEASVQMGALHAMAIELRTPRTTVPISNAYLAGGYYAIAFSAAGTRYEAGTAAAPDDTEHAAADLLFSLAAAYHQEWNAAEASLAELAQVLLVRPVVSQVAVGNLYNRTLLFGQPQSIDWRGVFVDADLRSTEPVAATAGEGRSRDFLLMSGLIGSMLEGDVLQQRLEVDAVSAAKLIQLARAASLPVRRIDAANVATELPQLSTAEIVRSEIAEAVRQGWSVLVPRSDFARNAWTGIGYVVTDPATGAAGYFISGGLAGSATSLDPHEWANEQFVELLGKPYQNQPNTNPNAAFSIRKVTVSDGQEGTAGTVVPRPLAVWVRDAEGIPVAGASVTFSIVAGGGSFNNVPDIVAVTDSMGVAKASPTLGRSTIEAPFYLKKNAADLHVTRVGENLVTARVRGQGGEIPLDVPFQLFGFPGAPAAIDRVLGQGNVAVVGTSGGTLRARVEDAFENPISNVLVRFTVQPAVPLAGSLPPTATNLVLYEPGTCAKPNPVVGDCAGQSTLAALSSVHGVSAESILGDTMATEFRVEATATGVPAQVFQLFSDGDRDYGTHAYRGPELAISQLELVNDYGLLVSATKAGTEFRRPLGAILTVLEDHYTVEPTGQSCGPQPADPDCYRVASLQTTRIRPVDVNRAGDPIRFPQKDAQVVDAARSAESGQVTFAPKAGAPTMNPPVAFQQAHNPGNGLYLSRLTTGAGPAQNVVELRGQATIWAPHIDRKTGVTTPVLVTLKPGERVNGFIPGTLTPEIDGTPIAPDQGVFGVRATIPDAQHVLLGASGASLANVDVEYKVEPAEYVAQQADVDLFRSTTSTDEWLGLLPGTAPQGQGRARIHRGSGGFDATTDFKLQLVLNRGSDAEIRSDKQDLSGYLTAPFGVDFRSRQNTAEQSRRKKSVDLAAGLVAEKGVLVSMITQGLAAGASCGVPLSQVAILEQGSGACFWRPGFAADPVGTCAAFHPSISDHDYEVLIPASASGGPAACLLDKLNDAGDVDNLGDVSFFAVPREEFVGAKLNIDPPTGGGADTTGDLGLGRQSLLLKWALEGEYINGVAGLSAPPLSLDSLLERLRTTPIIAGEPSGVPRLEGFEWATLQRYNVYKSGAHVRVGGAGADPKSYLYELQQKELHDVAKAGVRAAMGRLIAHPDGNRLLFIGRGLYRSPGGCYTGTESPSSPRQPLELFPKACDSFEEHIASTAVRSLKLDLGIFTEDEVKLIYQFYRLKADAACAAPQCQTQLVDDARANTFVADTIKFIQASAAATQPIYDQILAGGADDRSAQRQTNAADAQAKAATAAASVTRTLEERVLNATDLEFPGVPLQMQAAGVVAPGVPLVTHDLALLRAGSETIVDVVRDASGRPILDADGRPKRIFRPTQGATTPQTVSFRIDPANRIRECDKQDNFAGFVTYPLDPANPAPPVLPNVTPQPPLPAPPGACGTVARPALKLEKLVNGQPHIKVASNTAVQITHVVTNTGTAPLQGVVVADLLLNKTFGPITLAPGQKHMGFIGTYTPTQAGIELVGPSEALGFDSTGEGTATAWDSVAIDVVNPPCPLAIVPLLPDPNLYSEGQPISTVMRGGTALRHYQVRGASATNLPVSYTVNGQVFTATTDGEGRIVHTTPDGEIELGLPIDTTLLPGPGSYPVKFVSVGGSVSVCSQPFLVEVTPREFTRGYTAGASIDGALTVGVGLSGKAGAGLGFSLDELDGGVRSRLSVERSANASLGVQIGFSTPKARLMIPGVRAEVGGSVENAVSGTFVLSDTHEFAYLPGSPVLPAPASIALGGLVLSTLSTVTSNHAPFLAAVLEPIATLSNFGDFKSTDSVSFGLEDSATGSASAIVGLGFADRRKNEVFSTMRYGLGVGGSVGGSVSATISTDLNYKEHLLSPAFAIKAKVELGGFLGAGSVKAAYNADHKQKVIKLQDRFKASLKGSLAGGLKAKLALDENDDYGIKSLTVTVHTVKDFGWEVAGKAFGPVNGNGSGGNKISYSYTFTDRAAIEKVIDSLVSLENLAAVAEVGGGGLPGVLLGATVLGPELLELWHVLALSGSKYEVSTEKGNGISLPVSVELGLGASVKVGAALAFDRAITFSTERGVIANGVSYPLERYQEDQYIPVLPDSTDVSDLAAIVGESLSSVVNASRNVFASVDVVGKPVQPGPNTVRSNNTAQLDFDGATAPFTDVAIASFTYTAIPGPVAAGLQRPADTTGPADIPHFGIGGYHQFTPGDALLTAPAKLTIEYKDAEVALLDESTLAIYGWNSTIDNWEYVGGTVDTAANTITTQATRLGLYTAAPPMPGSRFTFSSQTAAAGPPEAPKTQVTYTSSVIRMNTGQQVPDGTVFTVRALQPDASDAVPFGAILTADADPATDGVQVVSSGGVIRFVAEFPGAFGAARILANSTRGVAIGDHVIPYQ